MVFFKCHVVTCLNTNCFDSQSQLNYFWCLYYFLCNIYVTVIRSEEKPFVEIETEIIQTEFGKTDVIRDCNSDADNNNFSEDSNEKAVQSNLQGIFKI